jgi:ankyrin repeat protein
MIQRQDSDTIATSNDTLLLSLQQLIRTFRDKHGNTILQLLLMSRNQDENQRRAINVLIRKAADEDFCDNDEDEDEVDFDETVTTSQHNKVVVMERRTKNRFRRQSKTTTTATSPLLEIIPFLVHCTDIATDPDDAILEQALEAHRHPHHSRYNSVVRVKNCEDHLPLHTACKHRYGGDEKKLCIVNYLLDSYPVAAQCPDTRGNLPLHYACGGNNSTLEVVMLLIAAHPESVFAPNVDNDLPLHLAVTAGSSTNLALRSRCQVLPGVLAGSARRNSSYQKKRMVITATTTPVEIDDDDNINNSPDLSKQIPPARRFSTGSHDTDDTLILQDDEIRRQQQHQVEIVQLLTTRFPQSLYSPNGRGNTPLQLAYLNMSVNPAMAEFLRDFAMHHPYDSDFESRKLVAC